MAEIEIKDFEQKAKTLIEIRRRMVAQENPTPELHSAFLNIPPSEAQHIYRMIDFFGMDRTDHISVPLSTTVSPVSPSNDVNNQTWVNIVKNAKKKMK